MDSLEVKKLTDSIIEEIVFMQPMFEDNPNGGHVYRCPFCSNYKEVKATDSVSMSEIEHTDNCTYVKASLIFKYL